MRSSPIGYRPAWYALRSLSQYTQPSESDISALFARPSLMIHDDEERGPQNSGHVQGLDKRKSKSVTYIRVPADLLDDIQVKVTGISEEVFGNLIRMLQTSKKIKRHGGLRPLSKLQLVILGLDMEILYPAMMSRDRLLRYVLLEDDHVLIRDLLRC